jgi:hypothetical protein
MFGLYFLFQHFQVGKETLALIIVQPGIISSYMQSKLIKNNSIKEYNL